ncbi:chromosomal replication initiator DnaA [uncultured Sphingosinicella sp.]|uniref:HdaA/DnaA family protein n=1 Tax=uncultured Sphingosinicella sp. TaxID=478748 RepID=UPI0030DC9F29|tara:strand:+ start:4999 stop:5637 length:639 start_codon:yes stop_codon:yes gene_type:complete
MSQFALPLEYRSADGEADFYISEANAAAVAMLDRWPDWPSHTLIVVGPEGSGKSHLLRLFAGRYPGAVHIFDDADAAGRDEDAMFHAWNAAQANGPALLVAARTPPGEWRVRLPDLASRLGAAGIIHIDAPDDALLAEIVAKSFRERGLRVSPIVIEYMIQRIERSFAAAASAVAAIDAAALAGQRAVTVPLVREALRLGDTTDGQERGETE